jgi:hypothetical protein
MNNPIYLLIADTLTAVQNDAEGENPSLETIIQALADTFKDNDSEFDRVQFLNDCELAEGEDDE